MIYIKKNTISCELLGVTPKIKQRLRAALSFEDTTIKIQQAMAMKRFKYVPKWLKGKEIVYLIDKDNKVPTGLLELVIDVLKENNEEYQFLEEPIIPEAKPIELINPPNFWQHQIDAVEAIKLNKNGMIRAGTGAGKTLLSTKAVAETGQFPFMFVVNRISLLNQAYNDFSKHFKEPIGWIGDGKIDVQRINIATIGTLCSMLNIKTEKDKEENLNYTKEQITSVKKLLKNCKFVICDELHHCSSNTYTKLFKNLPNAVYKCGLSATPFLTSGNDILLEAAFGKVIYSKSASELIKEKILCKPKIYFIEYEDSELSDKYSYYSKTKYQTVYKECVVENELFNNLVANIAIRNVKENKLTLIAVKQIKHGQNIQSAIQFINPNLRVEFLNGKNKVELGEEKVKEDFSSGKIQILISTIFTEGVDIPRIDTVIDAGGGSTIATLQLTGRAIRNYPGKKNAYVFMFLQPYKYLYSHSLDRIKILQTEPEFDIQTLEWN